MYPWYSLHISQELVEICSTLILVHRRSNAQTRRAEVLHLFKYSVLNLHMKITERASNNTDVSTEWPTCFRSLLDKTTHRQGWGRRLQLLHAIIMQEVCRRAGRHVNMNTCVTQQLSLTLTGEIPQMSFLYQGSPLKATFMHKYNVEIHVGDAQRPCGNVNWCRAKLPVVYCHFKASPLEEKPIHSSPVFECNIENIWPKFWFVYLKPAPLIIVETHPVEQKHVLQPPHERRVNRS